MPKKSGPVDYNILLNSLLLIDTNNESWQVNLLVSCAGVMFCMLKIGESREIRQEGICSFRVVGRNVYFMLICVYMCVCVVIMHLRERDIC